MADEGKSKVTRGLRRLAGAFVNLDGDAEGASAAEELNLDEAAGADAPRTTRIGIGSPPVSAAKVAPSSGVMSADFATIYGQLAVTEDPFAEPLLTAFGEMASLPEDSRRVPMQAMIKGMRANVPGVAQTLDARVKALQTTVAHQEQRTAQRATDRATDVGNVRKTNEAKVAELQKEIARLQREVADRDKAATESGAAEAAELSGFRTRVSAEVGRLGELRAFLATISTATKA